MTLNQPIFLNVFYFKIILILLLGSYIHKIVDSKLTKMSDNRYVLPGRSCGILNPVKFINELPKNEEEIQPCTIIDLTGNTRETSVKTPTTTTTIFLVDVLYGPFGGSLTSWSDENLSKDFGSITRVQITSGDIIDAIRDHPFF